MSSNQAPAPPVPQVETLVGGNHIGTLKEVTERHICEESRLMGGQASDQAKRRARPARRLHPRARQPQSNPLYLHQKPLPTIAENVSLLAAFVSGRTGVVAARLHNEMKAATIEMMIALPAVPNMRPLWSFVRA